MIMIKYIYMYMFKKRILGPPRPNSESRPETGGDLGHIEFASVTACRSPAR
jgi:hypothetical protein